MDPFVRHIRDGRSGDGSSPGPLALVERCCKQPGGREVLCQVFDNLCRAIGTGRAQATHVAVLCCSEPPERYAAAAAACGCPCRIIDCFTDPWGWNRPFSNTRSSDAGDSLPCLQDLPGIEGAVLAACASGEPAPAQESAGLTAIFIDDLGGLLQEHRPLQVSAMLCRILEHPLVSSCVIGLFTEVAATKAPLPSDIISASASAWLTAGPIPPLHAAAGSAAANMDGCLESRIQRKSGRIAVEQQVFALGADLSITLSAAPKPPTAQQLVEAALSKSAVSASKQEADQLAQELMKKMDGGMKLTLTEQEWAAKEKVVLPYEHRGDSSIYQADDFTQYLPPAAGGAGAGSGKDKLGHILYVRESDDEDEYDSDEDPDDDLDI